MTNQNKPFVKIFEGDGSSFSAKYDAERWLRDNGYSVGSSCVMYPQAIIKGNVCIAKWRNLTTMERHQVDGTLISDRHGQAKIILKVAPDCEASS